MYQSNKINNAKHQQINKLTISSKSIEFSIEEVEIKRVFSVDFYLAADCDSARLGAEKFDSHIWVNSLAKKSSLFGLIY